jgi:tripartite-type tricarboxylate transporter receptor subunit TctC
VKRFSVYALVLTAASGAAAPSAVGQDWPARPVRIVNTFAAGGTADILARAVADHLTGAFGQQFFVETRAGGGGTVGLQSAIHSDADGYTFVITSMSMIALAPVINPRIGYDPQRDVTHIAYIAGSPIVFVVNPKLGARTLGDLVAHGQKTDDPLTYSSSGLGSNGQLVAESFAQKAGIRVAHVPYKGASQGIADLVGGHIVFSAQTLSSASGYIRGGALIALAHTGEGRLPDYPDLPTFKEGGHDLVTTNWFALAGPPGLPRDIVHKINRQVVRAMTRPEAAERLRQDGLVARPLDVDAFAAFIAEEIARWKPVIERAGLVGK